MVKSDQKARITRIKQDVFPLIEILTATRDSAEIICPKTGKIKKYSTNQP